MSRDVLFSFMKDISAELFDLAVEIEEQLYDHPDTTLMKSRLFCEQILKLVFEKEEIKEVYPYKHVERIHTLYREQMIEEDLYVKLEWIRKKGNRAAHEIHTTKIEDVLKAHKFLYDIAVWYMQVYVSYEFEPPAYDVPRPRAKTSNLEDVEQLVKPYVDKAFEQIDSMWQEVNRELDVLNEEKERLSRQTTDQDAEREKVQKVPYPLIDYLDKHELTYIDNRDEDGALWVVGDWSLREYLFPLKEHKIYFHYAAKGGKDYSISASLDFTE